MVVAREGARTNSRPRGSQFWVRVVVIAAVAVVVNGCGIPQELTRQGYSVVNSSSNSYFVQVTWANGKVTDMAVPPNSEADERSESDPVRADVYDSTCALLVTLPMSGPWYYVLVDETGQITAMAHLSSPKLPSATEGPTKGVCPFGAN